ncbi:hypothetical protein ACJMK2_042037, partial [Sinanodonta woodiana]
MRQEFLNGGTHGNGARIPQWRYSWKWDKNSSMEVLMEMGQEFLNGGTPWKWGKNSSM